MAEKPQSFENHAKLVPLFHYVTLPALLVYFIWTVVRLVRTPDVENGMAALLGATLILVAFFGRVFALRVQDRVIRLEMRLRLRECLSADLQTRVPEFTIDQLVALRFASDAELPALAAQVLRDKLADKKEIKRLIRQWQADHARA